MSFYLTDLLEAVRKSGLEVIEVGGWRTRGHGAMSAVETIVVHHTATAKSAQGDYPSLGIVRDGRSDLAGPLAQLGLGRSGKVYVIAAGVCYHAGDVQTTTQDNWHAIGIEAEADGLSPWPAAQVDAYARLCAALCDHYGLTSARVQGHKEVCSPRGRKTDPNFDMDAFRARVTDYLEDDMPFTEDELRTIVRQEIQAALSETQGNGSTLAQNIRRAGDTKELAKEIAAALKKHAAVK
jgi:hypothetical protein